MNVSVILSNVWRFIFIFLFQILICVRIDLTYGNFNYIHLIVYPLAIIMLPLKTPKALVLVIAFFYGLLIDNFYNSPGVHAAAMVFTAYIKGLILKFLEPFEGYSADDYPTVRKMGLTWYMSFVSILLFIHCFFYFSVEAFSFIYFFDIIMNTIFSFIPSFSIILLIQLIFRPKQ